MSAKQPANNKPVQFDDVLKRMLATPPAPHVKKKPAAKPVKSNRAT